MLITNFQDYAFIALGSNLSSVLGGPRENVLEAVRRLEQLTDEPVAVSSLHETRPLDCPPGSPDFINAVLALLPRPDETAFSLLEDLQAIEASLGRVRSGIINEARIIDLDLLLFRDQQIDEAVLTLPHPAMLERDFVMKPLGELLDETELQDLKEFIKKNSAQVAELQGVKL